MELLASRELELDPVEGLSHNLVLQVGANRHYDLTNVDPGHSPGAFQRYRTYLSGA